MANPALISTFRRWWPLALLLVVGLVVWWTTRPSKPPVQAATPVERFRVAEPMVAALAPALQAHDAARLSLQPATRDPFAPILVVPPQVPVVQVTTAAPQAPLPVPTAPALGLQFAGRVITPEGTSMVYASLGGETIVLAVGQTLSNGYRVQAITAQAVAFTHPGFDMPASLPLPSPPPYEIR